MEINPNDYEYWGQWKQPVLSACFWLKWNNSESFKKINIDNITLHPILYLDGHFWISSKERAQFRKLSERILEKKHVEKYISLINKVFLDYEEKYLEILNISIKDKKAYSQKLFKLSEDINAIWTWIFFFVEELGKLIIERGIVSSEKDLIEKANQIKEETWLEKQNREINDFAKMSRSFGINKINSSDIEKNKTLRLKIIKHIKEFEWFGTHHWITKKYDLNECIDQINHIISTPDKVNERQEYNSEKDRSIALISRGVYWRTHLAEVMAKVSFKSRDILSSIAKIADISYDDLIYLTPEEILLINKDTDKVKIKKDISERKKGFGCIVESNKIKIVTGVELNYLLRKMIPEVDYSNINEFSGVTANKGEAIIGKAKILLSPDDFFKFNNEDILVASETSPDFVSLMKKASAIVTDIGGITSHAAIVSRELRKPCIIGTKIATKVLHDGDLVEVDADKGTVRIVERKN